MKKIISITFTGALSVVVLAWAFDAMGRIGHEEAAGHAAETGHEDAGVLDGVAELAAAGSSGEFDDILAVDLTDDDADDVRTRLSRRAMSGLELTDEQKEKFNTLRSAYTREMIQLRADSRLARVELRELMNEISPDLDRVKELAAAASAAQGSVFERIALFRAEFKHVLTPEQQENLRESFRDRHDGRRDAGMRWRRDGRESRNRR
ncbi:MAG: periplasmic heavy metal sensor [Gemmatimonadetes bacterium]|nr:periplasmic heavy metal sensor [Gemmatimonadota bacterium]